MLLSSKWSWVTGVLVLGALATVPQVASATANLGQIMPLGDSITNGNTSYLDSSSATGYTESLYGGGYRTEFYTRLNQAGYGFTFVGSRTDDTNVASPTYDNPSQTLINAKQTAQEGHPGYTIGRYLGDDGTPHPDGGVFANLTADTQYEVSHAGGASFVSGTPYINANVQPSNFLLLLGINNLLNNYSVSETVDSLRQVLTTLTATLPNAHVYVSTLIPYTYAGKPAIDGLTMQLVQSEIAQFNADLPALVANYDRSGHNVTLVDSYSKFVLPSGAVNSSLISPDGIHPTAAGYTVLGDTFADAVLANTPEPTSALLVSFTAAPLLLRRRRSF